MEVAIVGEGEGCCRLLMFNRPRCAERSDPWVRRVSGGSRLCMSFRNFLVRVLLSHEPRGLRLTATNDTCTKRRM